MMSKVRYHPRRVAAKPLFRSLRKSVLIHWLKQTKRKRMPWGNDIRYDAMDCAWHELTPEGVHCNFFCGVGEWVDNITDVLDDTTCDKLNFRDPRHHPRLYRQYIRILFIISELIDDLSNAIEECGGSTKQRSQRNLLFPEAHGLAGFVNLAIKHKTTVFHSHNNHLPIYFDDFHILPAESSAFSISTPCPQDPSCIQIPKLSVLIQFVLLAYQNFDDFLRNGDTKDKVARLVQKYAASPENITETP